MLAVSKRELPASTDVVNISREALEKELDFVGLLLFRNEVRGDSALAIDELHKASIKCVMCTGDNALTGLEVAREVNLMSLKETVMVDCIDGEICCDYSSGKRLHGVQDFSDVDLVVTVKAFQYLDLHQMLDHALPHVRVFARMQPQDKARVIELYQQSGRITGMVGDGGNDCGALRSAHVGIALSGAEASLVSPLSTKLESLMTIVDVVRAGRACLATNCATVIWFVICGVVISPSQFFLTKINHMTFSEVHYLFIKIVLCMLMVTFMTKCEPSAKLAPTRPSAQVFGPRAILTVFNCFLAWCAAMALTMWQMFKQDWYVSCDVVSLGCPSWLWMLWGDNYETEVTWLITSVVLTTAGYILSFGAEHRKFFLLNPGMSALLPVVVVLCGFLIWSENSIIHALFRFNCDNKSSMALDGSFLAALSAGPIGGCLLGPQMLHDYARLGDKFVFPKMPFCNVEQGVETPTDLHNILPHDYRVFLTFVVAGTVGFIVGVQGIMQFIHPKSRKNV